MDVRDIDYLIGKYGGNTTLYDVRRKIKEETEIICQNCCGRGYIEEQIPNFSFPLGSDGLGNDKYRKYTCHMCGGTGRVKK